MILHKIALENFRQFKGYQEIIFESELPNITIIYGENGRGKTGLFRALMFGLFDARRLPQDDDINQKDLSLVNTQALEEHEGCPVEAAVTVVISGNGCKYEICRKLQAVKKDNRIAEQPYGVSLVITDEYGNTKPPITDAVEIGEHVGKVFDPKIKDYFLFDGEKIERLTRADAAQKKTVSEGIKNLLNINDLENARTSMEILRARFNKQIGLRSQGNLPKVLKAIEQNSVDIANNIQERDTLRDNLAAAQRQKNKYDADLEKIEGIKAILAKRREYMERESYIQDMQSGRISFLSSRISVMSQILLKEHFQNVYAVLDSKKDAGEIPVQDKLELIKKILQDCKCICGSCVKEGSPEYDAIMEWRSKIYDSGLSDEALNVWRDLSFLLKMLPTNYEEIRQNFNAYDTNKKQLLEIREQLKNLSESINDGAEEEAGHFNRLREECLVSIGKYTNLISGLEKEYERLQEEKLDLIKKKEQVVQEEGVKSELMSAANLAADTLNALDEIYQSFTEDMKRQIGDQASRVMHHLLDKEGRYSLKRILVKDDYSLQVNDHRDEPFLANISAGQRQIISLCFITALAQVANGTERFEIPLFMDTPFGRLSFEHRNNLIQFIPQICQQWITMVTDTELTEKEWEVYRNADCNCVFYKLNSQPDGTTNITKIPLVEVTQAIM